MTLQQLITTYHQAYGKMPAAAFFCPGRLNLIGEHIDYNGGLVMPCAIDYGTYLLVAPNDDQKLRLRSLNFEESIELPLDAPITKLGQCWYNYPLGIFKLLGEQGIAVRNGFDFLFYGNLPIAAGLSSSASIEMVTGFAIGQL